MTTLGKIVRIVLIAGLVVAVFFIGRWTAPANSPAEYVSLKAEKATLEAQLAESNKTKLAFGEEIILLKSQLAEAKNDTLVEEPAEVPNTVNHFYDLATFYIDGDPKVEGFKTQGAEMKYTCQNSFGVFITMDPGSVNAYSTGDLGAVWFVSCKKGDVITMTTPHWSTSALHQQIHLVEFTQEISEKQAAEFLKILKVDEGKEVAFFIDSEGKVTKY